MTRVCFSFVLCLAISALPGMSAEAPPFGAEFDQALRDSVEARQFEGLAAAISQGESVRWSGSAGSCDRKAKVVCTEETRFRIASITKPMTAVAALQLHERGLLDLDAPILRYVPTYPSDPGSRITTRHLLFHSSGIGAYQGAKESETVEEFESLREAARVFEGRELLFEPGSRYSYTSYGYVVLGLVIEGASGMTYEDYMKEKVWGPASMTNTGVEHFGRSYPANSKLYSRSKRNRIKEASPNNLSNRVPGGGVYSTVGDLMRFGRAVLDGTLLSPESFALMQVFPEIDRGENNPYGMGWFIYENEPDTGAVIGHGGEQAGAAGQLMILPKQDLVVAVLSNTSHSWQHAIGLSVQLIRGVLAHGRASETPQQE